MADDGNTRRGERQPDRIVHNGTGGAWIPLLTVTGLGLAALAYRVGTVEPSGPVATRDPLADFAAVDQALQQAIEGSLAYNAPQSMRLEETVDVQLLVSPTLSPEALEEEISESGTEVGR